MPRPPSTFWAKAPQSAEWTQHTGVNAFGKANGLRPDAIHKVLAGDIKHIKGWVFRREEPGTATQAESPDHEPVANTQTAQQVAVSMRNDLGHVGTDVTKMLLGLDKPERHKMVRDWASKSMSMIAEKLAHYAQFPDEMPAKWDASKLIAGVKAFVESEGLEWKRIQDARSDLDKMLDAVGDITSTPEELFTQPDEVIEALEKSMLKALELTEQYIQHASGKVPEDPKSVPLEPDDPPRWMGGRDPKAVALSIRLWMARIRNIKNLKQMVREPWPKSLDNGTRLRRIALEATQPLRFQIWVGRSDIPGTDAQRVFRIGKHHVKMAVDIYMTARRASFEGKYHILFAGEKVTPGDGTYRHFVGSGRDGALVMYPPRHGKTAYIRHYAAWLIAHNPRIQMAYLHARQDEAMAFNKYVQSLFDDNNKPGRRNLALYPCRLASYDNGASTTRIETDDPPKNPNLLAESVWASAQGNNLDVIFGDDMVPQDDVEQPTQRERRKRTFSGTWLTRLQGRSAYYIVSGYPWHHDDLLWSMLEDARLNATSRGRKGKNIIVSKMAVGGPGTIPPYKPIWPEMYNHKALRQMYRRIGDASVWAANYQLEPVTDEFRIVRRVRLFDPAPPDDPEQHKRFLANAEIHLSMDPAFTRGDNSDKAGMVRVGLGRVDSRVDDGDTTRITSRMTIRVLDAVEIKSTQKELSDTVAAIARSNRVDLCHVETGNAGLATVEFLESLHGIRSVIQHKAGNRDKERRLRQVASMLEADAADIEAVVEFPGVRVEDGHDELGNPKHTLKIDPRFKQIHDYVVNFRVTSGHHSLDALTHVLSYLAPSVGIGSGNVSSEATRGFQEPGRKRRMVMQEREIRARAERVGIIRFAAGGLHV